MAQVLFHSLHAIDDYSFTLSVSLVKTSTEALLLLSLELPSIIEIGERRGAPLSSNQYGVLELTLPSMDLPLPMLFFSILLVTAI